MRQALFLKKKRDEEKKGESLHLQVAMEKVFGRLSEGQRKCVVAGGAVVGASLVVCRFARKRGVSVGQWFGLQAEMGLLVLRCEAEAQAGAPIWNPLDRLSRLGELLYLLSIERNRRFEVLEAATRFPGDADAIAAAACPKHFFAYNLENCYEPCGTQRFNDTSIRGTRERRRRRGVSGLRQLDGR